MKSKVILLCAFALSFVALLSERTYAEPPYAPGPSVLPVPGPAIPGPAVVPGKEYTPLGDMTNPAGGGRGLAPLNILQWDGFGGAITVTALPFPGGAVPEIDALANHADALFDEVVTNSAALLVSGIEDLIDPVMVESITGTVSTWATPAQLNFAGVSLPLGSTADLDALEVWGENFESDSDRFSLSSDFTTGVSVWALTPGGPVGYISQAEIAAAVGLPGEEGVDLDALMVLDRAAIDDFSWVPGDSILFSIQPIGPYDGGEIFVYTNSGGIGYLFHGGHFWDTANDVTALLGSENVDGLEAVGAVPEPSSMILAVFGAVSLAGYGLSRRNKCE